MEPYKNSDSIILQCFLIWMACASIFAVREVAPNIYRAFYIAIFLIIAWFHWKSFWMSSVARVYVIAILFGFIFHWVAGVELEERFHSMVLMRLAPVYLLYAFISIDRPARWVTLFVFLFFLLECGLSVYERVTLTHLISYENGMEESGLNFQSNVFRSFSLMMHPLCNANTVSIAMGFILCSDRMGRILKIFLMLMGIAALWGFNSRGAILAWAVIIIYRVALYHRKWWQVILVGGILYIVLPIVVDQLILSGQLGRLEGFDFSDGSTQTRFLAYGYFFNRDWSLQEILIGGIKITMPKSELLLENGILVDLGYWGFFLGAIKVIGEVVITYQAMTNYHMRDKLILLLATWGVAFMNNNSSGTWLMPMFVTFYTASAFFKKK